MQSIVMKMLLDNDLCVLCTCKNDIPNSSLMLYICEETCTKMYMLTLKESTKYLNVLDNTNVSLLIDTRDSVIDKATQVKALTIYGEASIVDDKTTSKRIIEQLVKKHNRLLPLASNKSVCVVEISIKSVLLLDGVDKSRFINWSGNFA